MHYLVAGGAGFLGSHLCDRLIASGHHVLCVDNLITGNKDNIKHLLTNKNFSFWQKDITTLSVILGSEATPESVKRGFWTSQNDDKELKEKNFSLDKVSAIYHLASPASPNAQSPQSYMNFPIQTLLANSLGTYYLLEIAKENQAKFLYVSSSEIYGEPKEHPQKESYFGNVNPNGPRSCYDEGKRFGEAMTFSYIRKFKIDARVVRIFNTYGPRMDPKDGRVVSNFIVSSLQNKPLTIYGDGSQTRSFCYVSDLIDGLVKAMNNPNSKGEIFNLGNDKEMSINALADLVEKTLGRKLQRVFKSLPKDDPTRRRPDLTKTRNILSFEPKVDLEEGLKKTIVHFLEE